MESTELKSEFISTLPDDFLQESNSIKAKSSIPAGRRYGPYAIKKCSTDHGDFSIVESSKQEESFQLMNEHDKWIKHIFLKKTDYDKPNIEMLVDDTSSLLMLEALEDIQENSALKSSQKSIFAPQSKAFSQNQVPAKICPHCGIRFSSNNTLKAHVASYCSRRPVNIDKAGGWQTRKRVAPANSTNMSSPLANNSLPATTNPTDHHSSTSPELSASNSAILQNELNNLFQHPAVLQNGVSASLLSPAFCVHCNLFFASRELFELHLKMSRENILMEPGAAASLVLAAPVFTNSGMHYIPIHPRTSSLVESLRSRVHEATSTNASTVSASQLSQFPAATTAPNTTGLSNLTPSSYLMAVNGILNPNKSEHLSMPSDKTDTKLNLSTACDGDDTKPLDLRMIAEAAANASNLQHFKILLPSGMTSPGLSKQSPLNNNITDNSDARRLEEHVLQSQAQCLLGKSIHDSQMSGLVQRPYLCSYCNTRFQSLSTFQAHQHFYCQKRHCFSKRRRLTGGGVTTGGHSSDENEDNSPTFPRVGKTSRQSSHPASSESPCGGNNKELLEINDNQRIFIEKVWEESKDGYRCCVCGYVGQTMRGMKMHVKMHECSYQTEENSDDNITVDVCSHPNDEEPQQSVFQFDCKSEPPKDCSNQSSTSPMNYKVTNNREETKSSEASQSMKHLGSKQCASCGTHFYQLPEFIKHMKVGCPQMRLSNIKQEDTSPV